MTRGDIISNEYFDWMIDHVCGGNYAKSVSYRRLLTQLHDTEFTYLIPRDANRAQDGIDLRYRFTSSMGYDDIDCDYLNGMLGPCSVLEMMVSLAIHCEESIMDDPQFGDRTGQWFWGMIVSLGLGSMSNDLYEREYVAVTVQRFLDRQYDRNGKGGLFTVRGRKEDMRDVEIWYQLNWYLDTIT